MKTLLKLSIVLAILGVAGAASYSPVTAYLKERNKVNYRTSKVALGDLIEEVNSTGEVKPVLSVLVGSFVSGPIEELYVDFNDRVKEGEILAKVDPRIYEAAVARDNATLKTAQAEVARIKALLLQAQRNEVRAVRLRDENPDYMSDTEMDTYRFNRVSLEAQLEVAEASVSQAQANLKNSQTNLDYTEIVSPVDGTVIERKIDPGQTLASQFQAPELFVIAPEMDQRMHIYASVDEADIGLIRAAAEEDRPVTFTIDAYPDDLFKGTIHQIRMSSSATSNVITYPVVVEAPNADLKLMPGMTANISFEVARRESVKKIPNAALRFYPDREQVRPEDHKIIDGTEFEQEQEQLADATGIRSASEIAEASERRRRRHVWQVDPATNLLRAVAVVTGISDSRYTELISGEIDEGAELVIDIDQ